MKVKPCFYLL